MVDKNGHQLLECTPFWKHLCVTHKKVRKGRPLRTISWFPSSISRQTIQTGTGAFVFEGLHTKCRHLRTFPRFHWANYAIWKSEPQRPPLKVDKAKGRQTTKRKDARAVLHATSKRHHYVAMLLMILLWPLGRRHLHLSSHHFRPSLCLLFACGR